MTQRKHTLSTGLAFLVVGLMSQLKRALNFGLLISILGLTISAPLGAADRRAEEGNWDNLKQLRVGQKIEVIDMNLKTLKGTFTALSDEAISFRTRKGEVSVGRADVFRVTDREHTRRGRNALIGAAILGGGVAALALPFSSSNAGNAGGLAGVIAAFAGAGAGLGAAVPSYQTIYRARKQRKGATP